MSSVARFKSTKGVTFPYSATRVWGDDLPMLLLGLCFGYKVLSSKIGFTDSSAITIRAFGMLVALWMVWQGAASIIGAVRRSIDVPVTSEGISNTTILGTSWAQWSSLGSFTEGTVHVGRLGVLPCVMPQSSATVRARAYCADRRF
jgi:hypothetical protein